MFSSCIYIQISNNECFLFPTAVHTSSTHYGLKGLLKEKNLVRRNIFGFNKDKPSSNDEATVPSTEAPVPSPPTLPSQDEQSKMAQKYQLMVTQALARKQLKVSIQGIDIVYSGDMHPHSIKISDEAIGKGAGKYLTINNQSFYNTCTGIYRLYSSSLSISLSFFLRTEKLGETMLFAVKKIHEQARTLMQMTLSEVQNELVPPKK